MPDRNPQRKLCALKHLRVGIALAACCLAGSFRQAVAGQKLGTQSVEAQSIPTQSPAKRSQPDVFLITIDTLRPDHIGCYGYKGIETPALDSLAADGVRFTQAFTHSPITNTSHVTIMTGLLPGVHGVTDFAVPLSPLHVTAAQLLKQRGYQTAAFIGSVILDSSQLSPGLDRGFDYYDNFPKTDSQTDESKNGDQKTGESKSKAHWGRIERRGMDVVEHAESWFDKHRGGPHFVWVHLYDPHDPYEPPPPFSEKYKDHLYDGEIAYADSALAHWIAYLKKCGVYDNALIVVTGDHGEGLGEHGEETHGVFLYDSTLHIPLIVKLGASAHRGAVIDAQVRTIDILPTILAATGVAPPEALNGESMLPLVEAGGDTKNSPARDLLGETDYPLRWGWSPLRALRTESSKLIQAPRPELYDLRADPKESKNLFADAGSAPIKKGMQADMAKWVALLPPSNNFNKADGELPDPKDEIEVQNLLHRAMLASTDHRWSEARESLEKAVRLDPKSATAHRQLGEIDLATGDLSEATARLKQACALRPDDATAAYELAEATVKSADWPAARDALEASLKLTPSRLPARIMLGRVYLQLKDAKNAEDQFEAALLVESENGDARLGLAQAQIEQSEFAAALPDLEALAKSDPKNSAASRLLAQAYRGLGRERDARRVEELHR